YSALAASPVLARDRPALVVAPAAADLQVARRVALVAEACPLDEALRPFVVGLDVRLEPAQLQLSERVAQDELEAFRHQSLAGRGGERVVAEVRALEEAARDLADVVDARQRAVAATTDEEAALGAARAALEVGVELARRLRRVDPRPVQAAAL